MRGRGGEGGRGRGIVRGLKKKWKIRRNVMIRITRIKTITIIIMMIIIIIIHDNNLC